MYKLKDKDNFDNYSFKKKKYYDLFKRIFDFVLSFILIIFFFLPIVLICILIFLSSSGPIIYWSDRIGQDNKIFNMPKFRTMLTSTPSVATHLLKDPEKYLTPIGKILRKFSLDELPQLWSVLKGDLSFVGPRPALFNQNDLIQLRTKNNIHKILPGITGLAQINGRDKLYISKKVKFDEEYMRIRSLIIDLKIIYITIKKVIISSDIKH